MLEHGSGQSSQTLFSTTRDTNQHSVTAWLHQYSRNTKNVRHSVIEENEIHLAGGIKVVVRESVFESTQELLSVFDRLIVLLLVVQFQNARVDNLFAARKEVLLLAGSHLEAAAD